MVKNLEEFFIEAQKHLTAFNLWAEKYSPKAVADHFCYKCVDRVEFETIRSWLETESIFIYQSIISQRRIVIVKFLKPIETVLGNIFYLELSDQKPDNSQTGGFDHVEIYPTSGGVEDLVNELATGGFILSKADRPHHVTFDGELENGLKIRLEPEPLIEKIKIKEMF